MRSLIQAHHSSKKVFFSKNIFIFLETDSREKNEKKNFIEF